MDLGHPQRPPPSYNQAVALHPPGARTVSGSDTDVSTSAENLTHEEKYVLSHTERQDPQGEENLVKTTLTGADFATPAGAMEWVKSVEKALKRPMGPPTGRPPPQYPRPGSAAAAAAAAAAAGQLPYSSLERLLGQRDVNGPPQVNGKEMKPPAMGGGGAGGGAAGGGGGTMSDKSNSSSSSQLAPAEGSSTGYDAGGAAGARADKSPLSRSQPDLNRNGPSDPLRPPGQYREPPDYVAANAHEMMQILMLENSTLKQELDVSQRKVQKLQKFARELEKLQSDYDDLVRTCQRREQLEFMARQKLTSEVRRATDLNNSLSSQLDTSKLDEGKKQTDRRELLIQQLVTQNKELQAVKERQEIELTAQRATLQEQRQYIDILDTALSKAQENVVRVEKEHSERLQTQYVERGTFVERVAQLQRALTSCQLAADRRETAHKKVRADLEREMAELKAAVAGKQGDDNGGSRQAAELADLRQKLRDANERILLLETELAHCQQKFVESARENELMLERSLPPRLEPPPPSHQLRHMSHGAQAHASMEERVLGLEARLVEKDAMIRALQKHALEVPALMRSSPHSRQSSLQSLAGVNSSYGMSQHGYSSSAYSSSSGARPPGSTNAGSMINMNRLHTVSSTPLSAEPRGAVSMASLSADISLLNASLASASLGSTAPTTAVTSAAVSAPHPAHSAASASPSHAASASASALDTGASILQALQKDREVFPEHYWHV